VVCKLVGVLFEKEPKVPLLVVWAKQRIEYLKIAVVQALHGGIVTFCWQSKCSLCMLHCFFTIAQQYNQNVVLLDVQFCSDVTSMLD